MAQPMPLDADSPEQLYTITLDGTQYQIRLVWFELRSSWYMDIALVDGTPILQGQRVSPGAKLNAGLLSGPPGMIAAVGPDPYQRDGIELFYVSADQLIVAEVPTTFTVVL